MAELVERSGVSRSTIHHYQNLGLLPPAELRGPKLHVYSEVHLNCLRQIVRWRRAGRTLPEIRAKIGRQLRAPTTGPAPVSGEREVIVRAAAALFLEDGAAKFRLSEIARAAGVSRRTVAKHFSSAEECFLASIDHLRLLLAPPEERRHASRAAGLWREVGRRARSVLSRSRGWVDLNCALMVARASDDPERAALAREAMFRMITNVEPSLRRAQSAQKLPPGDTELLMFMAWGALIYAGYWILDRSPRGLDRAIDEYTHLIIRGAQIKR